jgi:hypothetical protein
MPESSVYGKSSETWRIRIDVTNAFATNHACALCCMLRKYLDGSTISVMRPKIDGDRPLGDGYEGGYLEGYTCKKGDLLFFAEEGRL